jgi:pimeloyl-ACP methyl ester carboxylesterase
LNRLYGRFFVLSLNTDNSNQGRIFEQKAMKISFTLNTEILIIALTGFILFSCSKDEPVEIKPTATLLQQIDAGGLKSILTVAGYAELAGQIRYSVDMYKVTYPTTYKGKEIEASGLICVPVVSGSNFPVISFQHGTLVAKAEAPTVSFISQLNMAIAAIASKGYIISYPDLIGFGSTSGFFHPYYIKDANVTATTDMLKAFREFTSAQLSGVTANDSLYLAGYSQGGWITMAVFNEIEHQTSSGWQLIGTMCGAGPYNPETVMNYAMEVDQYEHPYYMAYVLLSFIDAGIIEDNLAKYIKEPYATRIPSLFNGTNSGNMIDAALTKIPGDFYSADLYANYSESRFNELRLAFKANQTGAWKNTTPLLLIHGEDDIYIPHTVSDQMYQDFIDKGSQNVQYELLPGLDHSTAAVPAMLSAITWFDSLRKPAR